jgi:hypothetical protein
MTLLPQQPTETIEEITGLHPFLILENATMDWIEYLWLALICSMLAISIYGIAMGVEIIDDTVTEDGDVSDIPPPESIPGRRATLDPAHMPRQSNHVRPKLAA